MLYRTRQRRVSEMAYLGRLIAASAMVPDVQYRFLTHLLSMELMQENYAPVNIKLKQDLIREIHQQRTAVVDTQMRVTKAVEKLSYSDESLRPVSSAELEEARRRMRSRALRKASPVAKPGT